MQEDKGLNPIFDAYRELRIVHQLDYTNYKLQDDHRIVSAMPRRQMAVISQLIFTWILLLVVMHVGVLVGALFPGSIFTVFHSREAIVVIIWLALAAWLHAPSNKVYSPNARSNATSNTVLGSGLYLNATTRRPLRMQKSRSCGRWNDCPSTKCAIFSSLTNGPASCCDGSGDQE
jgi:hypothetical protein